jgi:hypothetical protein
LMKLGILFPFNVFPLLLVWNVLLCLILSV